MISRVLLSLLPLLAACSSLPSVKFEGGPPLKVAIAGPMAGPNTVFGGQLRYGAGQAAENINAKGGVLGHVLTLRAVDDRCDANRAVGIARGLVVEKVAFVIGHFCSASSIAAAPVYGEANLLMIAPSASAPQLTDEASARGSTNVFRLVPRDDQQGTALAKYILGHLPNRPIALVEDGTAYGGSVVGSTQKALEEAGMRVALREAVPRRPGDFPGLVQRMKGLNVGVIVFGGQAEPAARLLVEARRQGLDAILGGGDALGTDDFQRLAGTTAEGTFLGHLPDARDLPTARYAVAGLTRYGIDAAGYTLYAYAAVELFTQAAERSKSLETEALAKTLRTGRFETVLGPLSFDAKGDLVDARTAVYVWHDGRLRKP